ncbi:unnamed protein product [Closterium sp. NIES-54]
MTDTRFLATARHSDSSLLLCAIHESITSMRMCILSALRAQQSHPSRLERLAVDGAARWPCGGSGGFGGGDGGSGGGGGSGGSGSGGSRVGAVQKGGSSGGQRQQQQRRSETPSPYHLREWFAQRGASGGSVRCLYVICTGDRAGQTCGKPHSQHHCFSCLNDAWRAEFGDEAKRPRWAELLMSGVDIFALDYDAILAAMYALSVSAEGDCYLCVPPDPGIEAAALGASESALPGTAPAEALRTFTLDLGASRCFFRDSTTLTPLSARVPVRLADPSGGQVLAHSSNVLPCPAVLSGSLLGLHLLSFSTKLVSTVALQDAMVTTTTLGGQRVSMCTCTRTRRHLATFTRRPGSSLYTQATEPPQVAASAQTLLWHHRLGHPSLPRLRGMHSHLLVSGLPRSLHPSRPRLPRPAFLASRGGSVPLLTPPPFPRRLESSLQALAEPGGPEPESAEPRGAEFEAAESGGACQNIASSPEATISGSPASLLRQSPVGPLLLPLRVSRRASYSSSPEATISVKTLFFVSNFQLLFLNSAEPRGTASAGGPAGASPCQSPRPEPLSPQQLREWFSQHTRLQSGAGGARGSTRGGTGAGGAGATGLGGAGVPAGAGGIGGAGVAGLGGARTRGTGAAGAGAGVVDPGAGGATAGGAAFGGNGAGGTVQRHPFFVPPPPLSLPPPYSVLRKVLSLPSSTGLPPSLLSPPPRLSQPQLQQDFTLPAPSPFAKQIDSFTNRREPESRPASPVRAVRTGRRVPRPFPPPVPGTNVMALCPSSLPLQVPLPPPPESSLPAISDPESDLARAACPTVSRLLATIVTDPFFESTAVSALVAELVDFAAACRLDYVTSLVAESASDCPPSIVGECALGTNVLKDRQEGFECLAAAVPHLVAMLLAPEGDSDAPDIPTPRSYTEAITDESVEPSGPYPELVGCLIYLMTCTRPDLAYPLSILARYVASGRHRPEHWEAAKRVLRYLCSTLGMGLVLGGRGPFVLTGHTDASWVDDLATQRSSQGYTFSIGSVSVPWQSTRSYSVLSSSCEAEINAGAMAAQELRWLTYLLTDLGERPRSSPVLYVDNKAMIVLCQEHRTKHIALRYFLARELQQRGQLRLAYVATRANTADIFTKALQSGDHQRFCPVLGLVPTLPHLLTA